MEGGGMHRLSWMLKECHMINLIRVVLAGGLIGLIGIFFIGGFVYNPIIAAPFAAADVYRIEQEKYVRPAYEVTFKDVCPSYRDASLWKKWTDSHFRSLSWCGDYIDRL
jgi:hypothetical protein